MKIFRSRFIKTFALVLTAGSLLAGGAAQAEYPEKPITLMVGFGAGGGTDTYARSLAGFSHEHLSMPMVVVNKPGAAGMIAATAASRARPDGYTLLVVGGATFLTKSIIDGERSPSPTKDFQVLGGLGNQVTALVVPMDSPFKSADKLVEYAKANPGKLRWSHPGRGGLHMISGMMFLKANGIKAQAVPFKGGGKARVAVAGEQVDFSFIGVQLMSGFETKLRALGITDAKRNEVFKDVPTFGEQGLPQMGISNPIIVYGKKDLPAEAVAKLQEGIAAIAQSKGYSKLTRKAGLAGYHMTAEQATARMSVLSDMLTPVTKELFNK